MTECYLQTETDRPVRCDDCEWTGTGAQLEMVRDIQERIDPGAEVPAGQCPECGSLAYVAEPNESFYGLAVERGGTTLKIEIRIDGAAFDAFNATGEVTRILERLATEVHGSERLPTEPRVILDANGNGVGSYGLFREPPACSPDDIPDVDHDDAVPTYQDVVDALRAGVTESDDQWTFGADLRSWPPFAARGGDTNYAAVDMIREAGVEIDGGNPDPEAGSFFATFETRDQVDAFVLSLAEMIHAAE